MTPTNSTSLTQFAQTIFSYNSNIMLAALISLLLVVLFVLLLHAYANCFFPHPRHHRRTSVTVSYVLAPPRLSRFDSVPFDLGSAPSNSKGLDPSVISAIPLFVYESEEKKCAAAAAAMECVICLSEFEERELGRRLPKCRHGFHLECIDMWLNSHANCPVCREPVIGEAVDCSDAVESGEGEIGRETVNEGQSVQFNSDSSSSSTSSVDPPPLMSSIGASLIRILSRNRSDGRIFPSSNGEELGV
ncbi:RING-H2 finger protein ATL63 [Cucumis sativus]|nr:RING-H2 finger protein ATL63 [Cucumis sativus]